MASIFKSKNYDYSYPRVRLSTTALRHSSVQPAAEDTTILFAAFASSKGPTDKIVKIHTLSEFVLTFGELDQKLYDINRQTIINICNWLNNGGTVYALRLVNPYDQPWTEAEFNVNETYYNKEANFAEIVFDEVGTGFTTGAANYFVKNIAKARYNKKKENYDEPVYAKAPIEAKYFGGYYENIFVSFKKVSEVTINATVIYNDGISYEVLEQFYRLNAKNYKAAFSSSEYIGYIDLSEATGIGIFNDSNGTVIDSALEVSYRLKDTSGSSVRFGDIEDYDTLEAMLKHFWAVDVAAYLGNSLETPIDVVLDAGYSDDLKVLLFNKLCSTGTGNVRDDIFLFLDQFHSFNRLQIPTASTIDLTNAVSERLAVYDQYFTINDATFTSQDIYVSPTYYVSKLLPYIDINYGIQWAMSGIRRAVLDDMKDINNNPGMAEKETLFKARINYAEKTARECAFMSQRTHDGSTEDNYTALSFINNSRTLEKIKKDLIRLGREYLFEFNDSITLSNMSNVLNKYLNGWISNRTLSHAEAIVSKNPWSDEAVDVTLVIKFTGTIEVISVDITIE